jgi:hypothetical protein
VGSTFDPGQRASFMFYVYSDAPHEVRARVRVRVN